MSIAYYVALVVYTGLRASFSVFWLALSLFFAGMCLLFSMRRFRMFLKELPLWVKIPVRTTIALGVLLFVVVESFVIYHMYEKPEKGLDYLVVLGAQVRGEQVSKSLRYRLDTAADYLEANPETRVVVTGGRGPGEDVAEAVAMRNYLMDQGIGRERIIMERHAVNTEQNLSYSKSLIGDSGQSVGIVTSSFHVFRAVSLAKKAGFQDVTGVAAPSVTGLLPNMMVREFFAVLKDKFMGNM